LFESNIKPDVHSHTPLTKIRFFDKSQLVQTGDDPVVIISAVKHPKGKIPQYFPIMTEGEGHKHDCLSVDLMKPALH